MILYFIECTREFQFDHLQKIPKTFSLKPKPKVDVVEVWLGITVKELAHVLQRNVDYVQDLFLNEIRGGMLL